jgi:outer membrane autotransporter protein
MKLHTSESLLAIVAVVAMFAPCLHTARAVGSGVVITGAGNATLNGTSITGDNGLFAKNGAHVNLINAHISTAGQQGAFGLGVDNAAINSIGSTVNVTNGDGAFVQHGGSLVLNHSTVNASGNGIMVGGGASGVRNQVTIMGGSLSAAKGDAFSVQNANADISVQGAAIHAGSGTLLRVMNGGASKSSLEVNFTASGATLAGNIVADGANVSLRDGSRLTGMIDPANVVIDSTSRWNMTANSMVSALVVNGGTVVFAPGGEFKKLTVTGGLSGNGHFEMNTNLRARQGDLLDAGSGTGKHEILVTNTGGSPTGPGQAVRLVANAGTAKFKLANPGAHVEAGMFDYELRKGGSGSATPESTSWYLANGNGTGGGASGGGALSTVGRAIVSTAGAQAESWFAELDTVQSRMGELRLGVLPVEPTTAKDDKKTVQETAPQVGEDVWVRGGGRRMNADASLSGEAFSQYLYGVDLGWDKRFRLGRSWLFAGLYGGWGGASRYFDSASNGLTEVVHGGLYASWLADTGWYVDGVAKLDYFDNRFAATSSLGETANGHYGNWGFGFSLEGGRQIALGEGLFVQPLVQLAYTHLSAADYSTSNDIGVALAGADVFQGRAGLVAGWNLKTRLGIVQPYVKASYLQTVSSGGQLSAGGYEGRPNFDGAGVEAGAGVAWRAASRVQLYGGYEFVAAEQYTQPWSVSGGVRVDW